VAAKTFEAVRVLCRWGMHKPGHVQPDPLCGLIGSFIKTNLHSCCVALLQAEDNHGRVLAQRTVGEGICGGAARPRGGASSGLGRRRLGRSAPPCWSRRRGVRRLDSRTPTRSARSSRCRARPPAGGKTALIGTQMAVDRIKQVGRHQRRHDELVIADYESKPDVGRRKARSSSLKTKSTPTRAASCRMSARLHAGVGGAQDRQHDRVCLDTTITTSKCSRYTFRPFDYAPAQAVAFAPYLVNKMGKKWHIAYADYAWGQSTHDAYAEQLRRRAARSWWHRHPLGTADMTPFLSKISGNFDGLFGIFFGKDGVRLVTRRTTSASRRSISGRATAPSPSPQTCQPSATDRGLCRDQSLRAGARRATGHCAHKQFLRRAVARLKQIDPSGPLPDRYVQSNYEAMNFLKLGMQKSGFRGRQDTIENSSRRSRVWRSRRATTSRRRQDAPQGRPPGLHP